jgi:hypothetical protein
MRFIPRVGIFSVMIVLTWIIVALLYYNVFVRENYYPVFTNSDQIEYAKTHGFGIFSRLL